MNMFIFGIITTTFTPVYLGLKPDNISDPVVWTAVAGAIVIFQCILPDLCGMYVKVTNAMEEPWKRESVPNVFKELAELASLPTYSPNRALWIYCVRFSIVQDPAYSHWLPMSIAIISMPGVGSTLKKVFVRTIGTIIGLLLGALSMYLIQITLPSMAMFVVLFSLFGFFACLFYHAR